MRNWTSVLLPVVLGFLASVASAQGRNLGFSITQTSLTDIQVEVRDNQTGQIIDDATVAVGELPGGLKILTVSKPGYLALTLAGVRPSSRVTIELDPLATEALQSIAHGNVTGWQPPRSLPLRPRPYGKPVSVGLVLRTLNPVDLLQFSVDSVVSPLRDTIDILGPRQIPSNLVMPEQTIPVVIGNVRVKKLNYRLPLDNGNPAHLGALQGVIDSKDLMNLRSGLSASAVNKLKFSRIGLSPAFTPERDLTLDIDANLDLVATHRVNVSRPPFAADVLVAAALDLEGDRSLLMPTDVKAPITLDGSGSQNPVTLRSIPGALGRTRSLFTVALSGDQRRLSGILTDQAGSDASPGEFLDIAELGDSPSLPDTLQITAPEGSISAAIFEGIDSVERRYPLWAVYVLPSAGTLALDPQTMSPSLPDRVQVYSLMRMEFGPALDVRQVESESLLQGLKRFARSFGRVALETGE